MPAWLSLYYDEPIELTGGEGCRVVDSNGKQYLDFFGGILTTISGHSVPEVVDAVREQAGRMLHSSTLYLIRPMIELAERIAQLSTIPNAKVFFVNSGSEAIETALLLATTARRSNKVLALQNSYHGRSFGAGAVTTIPSWSSSSFKPLAVATLPNCDPFRFPGEQTGHADPMTRCLGEARSTIDEVGPWDIACLVAEPIQGVGGFVVPPDGYLGKVKSILDEHGILFISDEVQTGWGRTGEHFWGFQAHGITPDLMTFAKGLGNGLAIGGVVGRGELIDSVSNKSISTFGGNPLACAGALANLRYLFENDLQKNALVVGDKLIAALKQGSEPIAIVGDVRGKGLMIGIELVEAGSKTPNSTAATLVMEKAKEAGLLIGQGGTYGNVLRLTPPMSITEADADMAIQILVDALWATSHSLA